MNKLKNKIKKTLKEVTADELGTTISMMKNQVRTELPSMEPDEVEDVVANSIGVADNELSEMDDYERISREVETGINPESGEINYAELDALVDLVNQDNIISNNTRDVDTIHPNDTQFESVNPRMSKNQIMEMVTNYGKPKVIKTIKVKDIKNGK